MSEAELPEIKNEPVVLDYPHVASGDLSEMEGAHYQQEWPALESGYVKGAQSKEGEEEDWPSLG